MTHTESSFLVQYAIKKDNNSGYRQKGHGFITVYDNRLYLNMYDRLEAAAKRALQTLSPDNRTTVLHPQIAYMLVVWEPSASAPDQLRFPSTTALTRDNYKEVLSYMKETKHRDYIQVVLAKNSEPPGPPPEYTDSGHA